MSPTGDAAHASRVDQRPLPNGVSRPEVVEQGTTQDDVAFRRALEGTGPGATLNTGFGVRRRCTWNYHGRYGECGAEAGDMATAPQTRGGQNPGATADDMVAESFEGGHARRTFVRQITVTTPSKINVFVYKWNVSVLRRELTEVILLDFLDMVVNEGVNKGSRSGELRGYDLGGRSSVFVDNVSGGNPPGLLGSQVPEQDTTKAGMSSPTTDPMEALMQGMSQLQAAMALQMGMAASKPEVIRPGVSGSELPKLPEADEQAAINVGDWLHGLAGPMGDLTDGSALWWADVLASLEAFYKDYVAASTVRKVQLRAEDYAMATLKDPKWVRLDKRAASMLLQAVPEGLKGELMANRLSSTISILGRILTIYRPGSAAERQQVLRALENPGTATTAADLVEVLRKWMRWLKRAQDLGLQIPDASILLKGLDSAAKQQMERSTEIVFRSNMLRYSLDLDSAPTLPNILKYHSHLLVEFEQLSFRGRTKTNNTAIPSVRNATTGGDSGTTTSAKTGTSPTATGSTKPCKFYLSDTGCQRATCRFYMTGKVFLENIGLISARDVERRGT
ncbi:TY4B-J [Symbiodinium sp. CCMP2456]|nr:TY4B-J [Symbiodinium sp. CCMP2456]